MNMDINDKNLSVNELEDVTGGALLGHRRTTTAKCLTCGTECTLDAASVAGLATVSAMCETCGNMKRMQIVRRT